MEKNSSNKILLFLIIAGVILGGLTGYFFSDSAKTVAPLGKYFLFVLKLIIYPLIITSIIVGITSLKDITKLGNLGIKTISYYFLTTGLAVLIGIFMVNLISPGEGIQMGNINEIPESIKAKKDRPFLGIIFEAFLSKTILVILFSVIAGIFLNIFSQKTAILIRFFNILNGYIFKIVYWVLWAAPVAIFALIASRFAEAGGGEAILLEISKIGKYCFTVILGLIIHGGILLASLLFFLGKRDPKEYFQNLFPALTMAFSTASSSATMPITLECLKKRSNVSPKAAGLVVPLGATINMDGTALYESVAAIFIAQIYGIDLSLTQQLIIFITATLAAIGAAGIPEAGLVMMVLVLQAVNLPLEGIAILLSIDWFLDRWRTTVNVWGDAVGAAIIDRSVKKSDTA